MGLFDAISDLFDPAETTSGGSIMGGGLDSGTGLFGLGVGLAENLIQEYMPQPSQSVPVSYPAPQPVGAFGGVPATAMMGVLRPILMKIAARLGLRGIPSATRAMQIVRNMAKYLSPAATATALGLTMGELATLITASQRRKRRRMNPANARALRRSLRRLRSFDRLASRVGAQLSSAVRGRRRSSHRRCVSCRKSPCIC